MHKPKITYRQYGGKASIASWIVANFPEHRVYLEPFCGSCSILFAKNPSFIEIVNDLDGRIVNMFEQIREHPEQLAAMLWATPYSAQNWRENILPDKLEDARLLMAQGGQFYCGNGNSSTWCIDKCGKKHKPKPEVWADWFLRIAPAAARLKSVQLLNEDGINAIKRVYLQEDALIYVDPPYFGHEKEYRYSTDYGQMVEVLNAAKAKVIVSEYEEVSDLYKGWRQVSKETAGRARTGAHNTTAKIKTEVLYIKNC